MSTDTITIEELIERIKMLVEANEAKDRYILQLEQQIDRDQHGTKIKKKRFKFTSAPIDPWAGLRPDEGVDGPQGAN